VCTSAVASAGAASRAPLSAPAPNADPVGRTHDGTSGCGTPRAHAHAVRALGVGHPRTAVCDLDRHDAVPPSTVYVPASRGAVVVPAGPEMRTDSERAEAANSALEALSARQHDTTIAWSPRVTRGHRLGVLRASQVRTRALAHPRRRARAKVLRAPGREVDALLRAHRDARAAPRASLVIDHGEQIDDVDGVGRARLLALLARDTTHRAVRFAHLGRSCEAHLTATGASSGTISSRPDAASRARRNAHFAPGAAVEVDHGQPTTIDRDGVERARGRRNRRTRNTPPGTRGRLRQGAHRMRTKGSTEYS
jgi:hypothetical protein